MADGGGRVGRRLRRPPPAPTSRAGRLLPLALALALAAAAAGASEAAVVCEAPGGAGGHEVALAPLDARGSCSAAWT